MSLQVSLESLVSHCLAPERLSGSNQYACSRCGCLRDGERRTTIAAAPRCLVLPLLRFAYDAHSGQHSKICTDVACPPTLRLPVTAADTPPAPAGLRKTSAKSTTPTRFVDYALAAVIVHSGLSSDGGHYYCYAAAAPSPPPGSQDARGRAGARGAARGKAVDAAAAQQQQQRWYMFNDNRVMYASYDAIRTLTPTFQRDTAYVLLYRRADPPALSSKQKAARVTSAVSSSLNSEPPLEDVIPATSSLRLDVLEDNRLYAEVLRSSSWLPSVL